MKTTFIKMSFLISSVIVFAGCGNTMGDTDKRLSSVKNLIEPIDGRAIILDPSPTASVYFEWDYVDVKESGTAVYQIAFDKPDGDFSNPVYLMPAAGNGYGNNVSVTHKQLNKIAGLAGISASETGTLKWTVFSSKGTNAVKSTQENTIALTRLAGFADLPIDVYLTGEGSEGGTDISKAHRMKAIAGGEFEVYTKLTADQPFHFTDAITGNARNFHTSDGMIKENGRTTVSTDGIYRINLDFNTGACSYALVTRIGFYFSPLGAIVFDLPYKEFGVFQTRETVTFHQESWGRDERYKFRMFVKENGGADEEKELEWATLNQTDSRPTATSPESYYYMQLTDNVTQWDNKWKLMGDFDGVEATYTIYLTADLPYTHSIAK